MKKSFSLLIFLSLFYNFLHWIHQPFNNSAETKLASFRRFTTTKLLPWPQVSISSLWPSFLHEITVSSSSNPRSNPIDRASWSSGVVQFKALAAAALFRASSSKLAVESSSSKLGDNNGHFWPFCTSGPWYFGYLLIDPKTIKFAERFTRTLTQANIPKLQPWSLNSCLLSLWP